MKTGDSEWLISDAGTLERLCKRVFVHPSSVKIKLQLPGADQEGQQMWEHKINAALQACGCEQGRFFTVPFLFSYLGYLYVSDAWYWSWAHFGIGFAVAAAGAVLGKISGLLLARIKMRQHCRELLQVLKQPEELLVA